VLELWVLGKCKLWVDGQFLSLPPKRLALVVYLALEGQTQAGGVRRNTVAELLWTDSDPESARRNLRQELHRLKQTPLAPWLELTPETLGLGSLECDALRFERGFQAGQDDFEQILKLYGGPLLEGLDVPSAGLFEEWLEVKRAALHAHWLELKRKQSAQLELQGNLRGAIEALSPLLETPDETAHREAMRLHALLGQREAALERYFSLKTLLERELNLEPSPETQALFERLRGLSGLSTTPVRAEPSVLHPPLIGREALLQTLERTLSEGKGLVLLEGEPGVGKSAVLEALSHHWGAVLTLRGREEAQNTPLLPLFEALRDRLHTLEELEPLWRREVARLIPDLEPELDLPPASSEGRARFLEGLSRALHIALGGGLLALEDLHWFDPSSLEVLSLWSRELGSRERRGARVLGAARPQESRENAALERWISTLERRGQLERIPLLPLSETETLRLVRALSPGGRGGALFSRRLFETTEGNPLFVLETLKSLLESGELREEGGDWHTRFDEATEDYRELPMPSSVQDALLSRLERLGDPVRRLLESAALLGGTFSWAELEDATPLNEWQALEALEGAILAGFVREQDGGYRFGHALMRRVLIEKLRPERRGLLHRKLVNTLEGLNAPPARLAPHLEGSGQRSRAAGVRLEAARAASQIYAHLEALEHYQKALENGLDTQTSFEVHLERAQVYRTLDDKLHWEGALEAAQIHSSGLKDPPRLELLQTELDFYAGRYTQALTRGKALWLCQDTTDEQKGWAGLWAGNALSRTSRLEEAMAWYEHSLERVPEHASELRGRLYNAWAFAANEAGLFELGLQKVHLSFRYFEAIHDLQGLTMAYNTAGNLAFSAEEDQKAASYFEKSYELACSLHNTTLQRTTLVNMGAAYLVLGQDDRALEVTNRCLEILAEYPDKYSECLLHNRLYYIYKNRREMTKAQHQLELSIVLADQENFMNWRIEFRIRQLELLASNQIQLGQDLLRFIEEHLPQLPLDTQNRLSSELGKWRVAGSVQQVTAK
jgi:DNA-binding SARP family transcriptional activator